MYFILDKTNQKFDCLPVEIHILCMKISCPFPIIPEIQIASEY